MLYKDLPKDLQKKAIEKNREWFCTYEWDSEYKNYFLPMFVEKLEKLGYLDAKVYCTGFGSQGDGACFECAVDGIALIKRHGLYNHMRSLHYWLKELGQSGYISISRMYWLHYYHSNTMGVDTEDIIRDIYDPSNINENKLYEQLEKLAKIALDESKQLAKEFYSQLSDAYYNVTSDENIHEYLMDDEETQYEQQPQHVVFL